MRADLNPTQPRPRNSPTGSTPISKNTASSSSRSAPRPTDEGMAHRWSMGDHVFRRFHMHFTPASASWFNMVERFFRDLSEHQLPRGVFTTSLSLSNPSDR